MREFLFEKFLGGLVELLVFFNFAKWSKKVDLKTVDPRARSMIEAAEELSIKIYNLKLNNKQTEIFKARKDRKTVIFKHLPIRVGYKAIYQKKIDDKLVSKRILIKKNLPASEGFNAYHYTRLVEERAKEIGFPLIVKPRRGSLSKNITREVNDLNKLRKILNSISTQMMIEKEYQGREYRVTLVAGKMVAACLREPAKITGDGKKTVNQLIKEKNRDKNDHRSATKRKVKRVKKEIEQDYIPEKNETIYLSDNINLNSGAQIHDVTQTVNKKNKKMFEKVAKLFSTSIIGLDYISKDISKPYKKIGGAIIELNSLPYINMHEYPHYGEPQEVAKKIWQEVLR